LVFIKSVKDIFTYLVFFRFDIRRTSPCKRTAKILPRHCRSSKKALLSIKHYFSSWEWCTGWLRDILFGPVKKQLSVMHSTCVYNFEATEFSKICVAFGLLYRYCLTQSELS